MDKPLLPINKPEYILHNISVMLFLFFSDPRLLLPQTQKKEDMICHFSPYVFS